MMRRKWIWLTFSVFAGLLAAVAFGALPSSKQAPSLRKSTSFAAAVPRLPRVLTEGIPPFLHASRTTLDAAQAEVGRTLLVPNSPPLASASDLQSVWVDPEGSGEVVMVFSQKILVASYPRTNTDPYAEAAALGGPPLASVDTVQGGPALVIEANGAGQGNVGSVGFALKGSYIVVYGFYASRYLLFIANSRWTPAPPLPSPTEISPSPTEISPSPTEISPSPSPT